MLVHTVFCRVRIGNQVQILNSPAAVNDGAAFIMPLSFLLGKAKVSNDV